MPISAYNHRYRHYDHFQDFGGDIPEPFRSYQQPRPVSRSSEDMERFGDMLFMTMVFSIIAEEDGDGDGGFGLDLGLSSDSEA